MLKKKCTLANDHKMPTRWKKKEKTYAVIDKIIHDSHLKVFKCDFFVALVLTIINGRCQSFRFTTKYKISRVLATEFQNTWCSYICFSGNLLQWNAIIISSIMAHLCALWGFWKLPWVTVHSGDFGQNSGILEKHQN